MSRRTKKDDDDHIIEILKQIEYQDAVDAPWPFSIPEGCAACGGDYPHCADSCPMFDGDD